MRSTSSALRVLSISSTSLKAADGSRRWVDPVLTRGRYFLVRRRWAWALITLFVALPLIRVDGKPGVFLDAVTRQFTVLGATFHPTDNLLLLALGPAVVIGVFAVTSIFGRVWCGYACPQPLYMEFVYRPLERLFEGSPGERRKRAQAPATALGVARTAGKWAAWTLVSLLLSATFVAYFVGWTSLVEALTVSPGEHRGALLTVLGTAGLMLFDFGNFRDQMCTMACPYGRLQTVLYDQDTVIVGYDAKRGEPRGRRRADATLPQGDCIDCLRCNTTCPTGMDIRRGLQMECIGCAQCIEACDEVMAKLKRPPGLIRYTSLRELETNTRRFLRPRVFVYLALTTLSLAALVAVSVLRSDAGAEIVRSGREPFRTLPTGEIANLLRVRLTNNLREPQSFTIQMTEPQGATLVVSQSPFPVAGDHVDTVDVVAKVPEAVFVNGQAKARFLIQSNAGVTLRKEFLLLGPFR